MANWVEQLNTYIKENIWILIGVLIVTIVTTFSLHVAALV